MEALENGAVETLIVYDSLEMTHEDDDFVDWIAEHYKDYGCKLAFVSDQSSEGTQFVEGFGGIGGILRYKIDILEDFGSDNELSSFSEEEDDIF